jgi:hypothetical protein
MNRMKSKWIMRPDRSWVKLPIQIIEEEKPHDDLSECKNPDIQHWNVGFDTFLTKLMEIK